MHIDDWEEAPGSPGRFLGDKSELPREVPSGIVEAPSEIVGGPRKSSLDPRRSQELLGGPQEVPGGL